MSALLTIDCTIRFLFVLSHHHVAKSYSPLSFFSSMSDGTLIGIGVGCAFSGLLLGALVVYVVKRGDNRDVVETIDGGQPRVDHTLRNNHGDPKTILDGESIGSGDQKFSSSQYGGVNLDRSVSNVTETTRLSFAPSQNGSSGQKSTPATPLGAVPGSPSTPGLANGSLGGSSPNINCLSSPPRNGSHLKRQTSKV